MNPSRSPVAFGRYIITRRIARGGMAEIYRARTRSFEGQSARWVAIKMMRSTLGHEELRERLFEREVRITTRLKHTNVVPVYEFGQELGRPYLAMEYVRGRDLAHILKPGGGEDQRPIHFELGLYIGLLAARGLGHAHRLRDEETGEPLDIVHRDVSPGNVMVGYDGGVKVLDFGVARVNETQGYQTQTGTLRGKFAYMSPEQTLGEEIDARSDVFSFGTVLYELLTGANCFRADDPIATLERVQGTRPVPPSRARREIPKDVDRILAQCLSKDKRRRFPDGIALSEALGEFLDKRGYDGHAALIEHMASTFSWEQHEESSELAREEEEVALMEVVDFVPDVTNDGLDSKYIAVSTQEEASSSEVRQMAVARPAGTGAVFADYPSSTGVHMLDEDQPLGRGQAVRASSLLQPPVTARLGSSAPVQASTWVDDEQKTEHAATGLSAALAAPPPPLVPRTPWYRLPAVIAAGAAAVILVIAFVAANTSSAPAEEPAPPNKAAAGTPTIEPVTIRLNEKAGNTAKARRKRRRSRRGTQALARNGSTEDAEARDQNDDGDVKRNGSSRTRGRKRSARRRSRAKKGVTGFLNVGARPWAEITIDGKRWPHQTPQAGIELPVGKHVVVLHNPKTGVTKRTAVYIKHGQYRTVNLDLRRRR